MNVQIAQTHCAIQYCPASAAGFRAFPWHCGQHRFPGGEGDHALTVTVNGEDGSFVDGITYAVTYGSGRSVKGRTVGRFSLQQSNDSRLHFARTEWEWVQVDPDLISDVVAL